MSQRRFLSPLAAVVALAIALAGCGGDGGGGDPQAVIQNATLQGIESGSLDLSLAVDAKGKEGGALDASLSGPFQAGATKDDLPQLDWTVEFSSSFGGEELNFEGGAVLLPNSAYVNYQGTEYEVDPTTFSFVESVIAPQGGEAESPRSLACQEAASELKVSDFIDNLSGGESADVDGTETTKVSGDLDVTGAIDALLDLSEDPACGAQLGATESLPSKAELEKARGEVKGAVKTAHIDVYVGDDDIVRQVSANLRLDPPKRSSDGPENLEIDVEMVLTGVNEEQEIAAPDGAKPLNDLFIKLNVNPIELLGIVQGEGGGAVLRSLLGKIAADAGGSAGSGKSGGGNQQAYLKCLQEVGSAADLQKCINLR